MSLSKTELKNIFLKDDILPLGDFESLPVTCAGGGMPSDYPDVLQIGVGIDYKSLLREANDHIGVIGFNYVRPRIAHINKDVNEDVLREVLGDVGFTKSSYQSFSLRKIGTNELEDWIGEHTRKLVDDLPVNVFRQQYAVAFGGWCTKMHRDHKDFTIHGFRAMVPLSSDVYMGYENSDGEKVVYRLARGGMYFVNIAKMHRGFNESQIDDRINLIMQMDSDVMLNDGDNITPLSARELDELPKYATEYGTWVFGDEL